MRSFLIIFRLHKIFPDLSFLKSNFKSLTLLLSCIAELKFQPFSKTKNGRLSDVKQKWTKVPGVSQWDEFKWISKTKMRGRCSNKFSVVENQQLQNCLARTVKLLGKIKDKTKNNWFLFSSDFRGFMICFGCGGVLSNECWTLSWSAFCIGTYNLLVLDIKRFFTFIWDLRQWIRWFRRYRLS